MGRFGRSWALLGRSWGALGRSWGALGRLLDALGRSWTLLGALGALLGRSWLDLGPSLDVRLSWESPELLQEDSEQLKRTNANIPKAPKSVQERSEKIPKAKYSSVG